MKTVKDCQPINKLWWPVGMSWDISSAEWKPIYGAVLHVADQPKSTDMKYFISVPKSKNVIGTSLSKNDLHEEKNRNM